MHNAVQYGPDTAWNAIGPGALTRDAEAVAEQGGVLCFPNLRFDVFGDEHRLLNADVADGKAKNISLRGAHDDVRGGHPAHANALRTMIQRYRMQATALAERLFPRYRGHMVPGNTSYRPVAIEGRATSRRKDDTQLHVDSFPSNPVQGRRLLRVFHNLHPRGLPRSWRVGEPFEDFAQRFVPAIRGPLPGSAAMLHALRITKSKRSVYDHYMLQLHDRVKADAAYQRSAPQQNVDFTPGATWVLYSDQVLHAAVRGQFMLEQTFYVDPAGLLMPASSPLAVLQRLVGRPLL